MQWLHGHRRAVRHRLTGGSFTCRLQQGQERTRSRRFRMHEFLCQDVPRQPTRHPPLHVCQQRRWQALPDPCLVPEHDQVLR